MAINSAICNTFKGELLEAKHSFAASGGHTFKLALFTSSASLGASTTASNFKRARQTARKP